MNYGIIDIGSNTIRLVIYRVIENRFECLFNEKHFVQLIGYVKDGIIAEEGLSSLIKSLKQLQSIANHLVPIIIKCFATAPFRAVNDKEHLLNTVKSHTGLDVDILDGEEEAVLGLAGAQYPDGIKDGLFVDLGGGSIETTLLKNSNIEHVQSIDIGCVNLSNKFISGIIPKKQEIRGLEKYIDRQLKNIEWLDSSAGSDMYCIGGTARALVQIHKAIHCKDTEINEYSVCPREIKDVYNYILDLDEQGPRFLTKHCPGRIFTFIPGAILLWRVAKRAEINSVRFKTYGVREGYLIRRIMINGLSPESVLGI